MHGSPALNKCLHKGPFTISVLLAPHTGHMVSAAMTAEMMRFCDLMLFT